MTVHDDLKTRIESGEFPIASSLPGESALQGRYGVSRVTLRRAVDRLVSTGHVERVQGKGTFVLGNGITSSPMSLGGFGSNDSDFKVGPRRRVLLAEERGASRIEARFLGIQELAPVFHLERLLLDGEHVLALDSTAYPARELPNFLDHVNDDVSTFSVLRERFGQKLVSAKGDISMRMANAKDAGLLGVARYGPVMVIDKVVATSGGNLVAYSRLELDPYLVHLHFEAI